MEDVKRLIKIPDGHNIDDTLVGKAYKIESGLLLAGGIPNVSYTFMDCFNIATELENAKALKFIAEKAEKVDDIFCVLEDISRQFSGVVDEFHIVNKNYTDSVVESLSSIAQNLDNISSYIRRM